jgi:tRNA(adenine34) deaminase
MSLAEKDTYWMKAALRLARKAAVLGEVPIAAIVVDDQGSMVSYAINTRERQNTPLGHAELFALHKASQKKGNWRLNDCTLYVTLEPCVMCAGAIQQSRISRVVYGAKDPKGGAVESLYQVLKDPRLNHLVETSGGVLEDECQTLMSGFFQDKREEKRSEKAQKIYRERTSVIVVHKNTILGFHAVDPTSQVPYFFLPGGGIEEGESVIEAAERECLEETGYRAKVLPETAFERKYDFFWNGQSYACRTIFYVAELLEPWTPPKAVTDTSYHKGVAWVPTSKVREIFGYQPDILWAVQKLLKTALKRSTLR